jgi:5-methylthioadenosine/S-adenosylhomocysteine deaminase
MEPGGEPLIGGAVGVRNGRIAAVGKPAELKRMGFGEGKILNARGHAILPGLVNAHTHVTGMLLKGLPEETSARARIHRVLRLIFKEAEISELKVLARVSFLEAIKCGVTCLGILDRHALELEEPARESGIRTVLAEAITETDIVPASEGKTPKTDAGVGSAAVAEFLYRVDGICSEEATRITPRLGMYSPSVCSDETLELIASEAETRKLGLHYHLGVFPGEMGALRSRAGGDLWGFLRRFDLLRSNTLLAGGNVLHEDDISALRGCAAQMVVTPRSDAARGVRIRLASYLRNKIPLALGTGGIGHDLFAVMRAFTLSARLDAESASVVGPGDVLRMATRDGARSLGLLGSVGSIEIGKKADLICIALDPARIPLCESKNINEIITEVSGPRDVTDVVVDGEVLMEGGKVLSIDEKKVIKEAQKVSAAIWKRTEG